MLSQKAVQEMSLVHNRLGVERPRAAGTLNQVFPRRPGTPLMTGWAQGFSGGFADLSLDWRAL